MALVVSACIHTAPQGSIMWRNWLCDESGVGGCFERALVKWFDRFFHAMSPDWKKCLNRQATKSVGLRPTYDSHRYIRSLFICLHKIVTNNRDTVIVPLQLWAGYIFLYWNGCLQFKIGSLFMLKWKIPKRMFIRKTGQADGAILKETVHLRKICIFN